jgi:hypothetical protein
VRYLPAPDFLPRYQAPARSLRRPSRALANCSPQRLRVERRASGDASSVMALDGEQPQLPSGGGACGGVGRVVDTRVRAMACGISGGRDFRPVAVSLGACLLRQASGVRCCCRSTASSVELCRRPVLQLVHEWQLDPSNLELNHPGLEPEGGSVVACDQRSSRLGLLRPVVTEAMPTGHAWTWR